ncbi:MAG: NAD-dependent malic enzyme [Acidobacteriia bacterium]|nr:NAD-dependent malic enzyme [Terriglobia bacterium]
MTPLPAALHGARLLSTPAYNKGTAFTIEERFRFGLHGLLPPYVETLEEQVARAYTAYLAYEKPLNRHIYLRALQDNNEVLFYRLLLDHIEEMMPVVYTPVVAEACRHFSHIYRRPRGLFISYPLRDSIPELLRNRPHPEVDVIVVTDGERILGIGDQGVGGLAIPIGKLSLYALIGGIHPMRTLPIVLDAGSNNQEARSDPTYLGWHHQRIAGPAYDEFIDQFVKAVRQELPHACLQWEDFATTHARTILDRYRNEHLSFNDDIQGTGAVVLGAVLSAAKAARSRIRDQKIVFLGAGSASIGVADYLRAAMRDDGLTESEALDRFWIVDKDGLLHDRRTDLTAEQRVYARTNAASITLSAVIQSIDATVLIGLSTARGAFAESIVREMARKTARPIILPLSNPTERSEAIPTDLLAWTNGRALIATGSPFAGIAQCNNVYIFPAIGLACVAARARRVTDGMFLAAARALADNSPGDPLLPALHDLRSVTTKLAFEIAKEAQRSGVADPMSDEALTQAIAAAQWFPNYPVF